MSGASPRSNSYANRGDYPLQVNDFPPVKFPVRRCFLRRLSLVLALLLGPPPVGFSSPRSSGSHSHSNHSSNSTTSRKSSAPGRGDGHYAGGRGGSSHKGGHYRNPTAHDHYRHRKH